MSVSPPRCTQKMGWALLATYDAGAGAARDNQGGTETSGTDSETSGQIYFPLPICYSASQQRSNEVIHAKGGARRNLLIYKCTNFMLLIRYS